MKYALSVLLLLNTSHPAHAGGLADEREQAAAACRILDAWHAEQPEPGERHLHIVCWTPADRELPARYPARLTRIMRNIQDFYAGEMQRLGFGNRTIGLQLDDKQQLILHEVRGLHNTDHYSGTSGNEIRKECLPVLLAAGVDADRETIMIMCNLATWDAKALTFSHKSPYYASGSFRNGTAWQLDSPELDTTNMRLKKPMIRDAQYGRISLGKHNSIFFGGIAHELGHALGLPHCEARPDEAVRGKTLMGSGFQVYGDEIRSEGRGSILTLADALRLASHPQFSRSVKGLNENATAGIDQLTITADGKAIKVTGVVSGSPPIYAVVAYFDPDGGSDDDATTASAVPDANGRFTLKSDALTRGKQGELRLFPLHANGSAAGQTSHTTFRYSYGVSQDGTLDMSAVEMRQELTKFVAAFSSKDNEKATQLATEIKSAKAAAIARSLLHPTIAQQTPAEYDGNSTVISLTHFKPTTANVGWGEPIFNRVPEDAMLLDSGGQIFETGIYAHAPASHLYELGGKWKTLSGKVGLASGHNGAVQFEIKGDGRSLWKSPVVYSDKTIDFEVELKGVQHAELLTDPTEDGPGGDWALWLEPVLKRR
ncbi:MAG TPA: NPCBM/NEW2 domain-containing protein [Planctomycetaceae bacterium]|nr:NPCBM/NEW2 domain-containing protein [Planctomycetaceae bacterium]